MVVVIMLVFDRIIKVSIFTVVLPQGFAEHTCSTCFSLDWFNIIGIMTVNVECMSVYIP